VPTFSAKVELRFESESLESAGADLRRLQEAAQAAGFDLIRGEVVPAEGGGRQSNGTSYGPFSEPPRR
jgi:hypothetical protein